MSILDLVHNIRLTTEVPEPGRVKDRGFQSEPGLKPEKKIRKALVNVRWGHSGPGRRRFSPTSGFRRNCQSSSNVIQVNLNLDVESGFDDTVVVARDSTLLLQLRNRVVVFT